MARVFFTGTSRSIRCCWCTRSMFTGVLILPQIDVLDVPSIAKFNAFVPYPRWWLLPVTFEAFKGQGLCHAEDLGRRQGMPPRASARAFARETRHGWWAKCFWRWQTRPWHDMVGSGRNSTEQPGSDSEDWGFQRSFCSQRSWGCNQTYQEVEHDTTDWTVWRFLCRVLCHAHYYHEEPFWSIIPTFVQLGNAKHNWLPMFPLSLYIQIHLHCIHVSSIIKHNKTSKLEHHWLQSVKALLSRWHSRLTKHYIYSWGKQQTQRTYYEKHVFFVFKYFCHYI